MAIVSMVKDDLVFDWNQLPEQLHANTELRDKLFNEVQQKFAVSYVDNKVLFEMNKYVIDRVKSSLNPGVKNVKG